MLAHQPIGQAAAARLATRLHAGQTDKLGEPYVAHLQRVAVAVTRAGGTTDQIIAAWLHDAVEDTGIDADGLRRAGASAEVVRLVDLLTRRDEEGYDAFIRRCAPDPGANLIKRMDVADHRSRLHRIEDEATRDRLTRKYDVAWRILTGIE